MPTEIGYRYEALDGYPFKMTDVCEITFSTVAFTSRPLFVCLTPLPPLVHFLVDGS